MIFVSEIWISDTTSVSEDNFVSLRRQNYKTKIWDDNLPNSNQCKYLNKTLKIGLKWFLKSNCKLNHSRNDLFYGFGQFIDAKHYIHF